jgi:hypothetical protein
VADTQHWSSHETKVSSRQRASDRAFRLYRGLILVYAGFLLGILGHAGWTGDDDLVFWPWSSAFLLMLIGFVVWQRRRSSDDAGSRASQSPARPEL